MTSSSPVRPTKRRREDLDEKIEAVSEVIHSMTGSKKTFLQAKLNNLKLKKQKLLALTHYRPEEGTENPVTEFDVLITENDIDIEIESIRSCKKFKRSEIKYFARLYRDSCTKENKSCSTSSKSSSPDSAKVTNCPEISEAHINGQNASNPGTENKVQCNKSTNTEPLYIIHAKKYVLGLGPTGECTKEISQPESSSSYHDRCIRDEEKLLEQFEAMPYSKEPMSMTDYLLAREEFMPVQENNPEKNIQSEKHNTNLRMSDQSSIQSTWFENSFEIENACDRTDANEQPHLPDNSASKSTAKQYKPKTYENKNKVPSVLQNPSETISEQNYFASTTNINGTKDSEVASRSTNSTLLKAPVSCSEPALSEVTLTPSFPNIAPARATNTEIQNSIKTEPKDTEIEAIHSHSLIAKLFGNYKTIYSPEKDNNLEKPIPSVQNDVNNNDDTIIITTNIDLAEPNENVTSETNYTINYLNSEKTIGLNAEPFKMVKDCESKDLQPNSSQKNNFNDLKYEKWLSHFRQEYCDKISRLSANSQQISNKCMENSAKCQDEPIKLLAQKLPTKSKDLVVKSQDLSSKSQDLPVKCQDRPKKSQDWSAKSLNQADRTQDQDDKSQDRAIKSHDKPNKSQDRSVKSQDRSAKSRHLSAKSLDRLDKSRDRSVKIQDRPAKCQDRSSAYQDGIAKTQAQSATSQDGLAETQDRSDKSQDRSTKSQDDPFKSHDRPAEFQELSVEYQKLSVKYQEYCAKLQYVQDLYQKSSPNSKISDKKSHKNSEKDKSKKRTKESEKSLSYKSELKDSAKMERSNKHSSAKNSDKSQKSSAKKSEKKGHDSSAKHLEKGQNSSAKNLEKYGENPSTSY